MSRSYDPLQKIFGNSIERSTLSMECTPMDKGWSWQIWETCIPPKWDGNVANLTSCRLLFPPKLHQNKYNQDGEGCESEREKPELALMRNLPVNVRLPMTNNHVWSVAVMMHYIPLRLNELSQPWTSYRWFSLKRIFCFGCFGFFRLIRFTTIQLFKTSLVPNTYIQKRGSSVDF